MIYASSYSLNLRNISAVSIFYVILILGAFILSIPTLWMFSASFMGQAELLSASIKIIPEKINFSNYVEVFTKFNFGHYLLNSIFVTGSIVILNVLLCPLIGYSLARFNFPGKKVIFIFIIATIMVPFASILVPLFLIIRTFDWINTYQALIVPFSMSAFGIFLMRQFIYSVPSDYLDAARIDGAGELTIYWKIIVPICQPAMVTLAIITFIATWDELLWVLVATSSEDYRTLPIGLAKFVELYETRWDLIMSGSVIAALPMLFVFILLQKRFLAGISSLSGIK